MLDQSEQVQIQVKEVVFTAQEISSIDTLISNLPYKVAKPIYDIINNAISRTANAIIKEKEETKIHKCEPEPMVH